MLYIYFLVEIVFFSKFDPGARVDEAYFRYFLGKLLQNCKVRFQHSLMLCYFLDKEKHGNKGLFLTQQLCTTKLICMFKWLW